jgi:hypothetical protein
MSRLTEFYRGTGVDAEGRTLEQIWAYSDEEMEAIHDFIQWLFPLKEPSRFNPDAPLLTDADVAEFQSDPRLKENLRHSFELFLAFLGLRCEDGRIVKAPDFDKKAGVWRHPNHNWLRITRVLSSVRMLGLDEPCRAFFEFLSALRHQGRSGITSSTFQYWDHAANGTMKSE